MEESSDYSSLQKQSSKQDPNNFRPISVIGRMPKLFEKLVDSIERIFTILLFHYTFTVSFHETPFNSRRLCICDYVNMCLTI